MKIIKKNKPKKTWLSEQFNKSNQECLNILNFKKIGFHCNWNSETLVYIKWDTGVWVYERKLFGKLEYNTCL
jgi:hypothetical protein